MSLGGNLVGTLMISQHRIGIPLGVHRQAWQPDQMPATRKMDLKGLVRLNTIAQNRYYLPVQLGILVRRDRGIFGFFQHELWLPTCQPFY